MRREPSTPEAISFYSIMMTKLSQEGDALWGRFNIMVALQLAFFGAAGFILLNPSNLPANQHAFLIAVYLGGFVTSLLSWYVLHRQWKWHRHWAEQIKLIEAVLPHARFGTRPLTQFSRHKGYDSFIGSSLVFKPTNLFFLLFAIVWFCLLAFIVVDAFPSTSVNPFPASRSSN